MVIIVSLSPSFGRTKNVLPEIRSRPACKARTFVVASFLSNVAFVTVLTLRQGNIRISGVERD